MSKSIFWENKQKNTVDMSSAEVAQNVVKVKHVISCSNLCMLGNYACFFFFCHLWIFFLN